MYISIYGSDTVSVVSVKEGLGGDCRWFSSTKVTYLREVNMKTN